jgi:hypothetical protein
MRYTVVWNPSAETELAAIWTLSIDRQAVTASSNTIDEALRIDPLLRGETHRGSIRAIVEPPLIVTYRVFEDDRIVRVLTVERLPTDDSRN